MEVVVYGTTSSLYFKMLKDYLKEQNVSFVEKLIDQSESERDEMMSRSGGFLGVPFLVINKNGKEEKVVGFDKNKINELIK